MSRYLFIIALILAFGQLSYGQMPHHVQLNAAGSPPTIINGSATGGSYTYPDGGGIILTTGGGGPSLAWLTAGNLLTGAGPATPNQIFGSTNNYDVILAASNIEKMRLIAGGGVSITGGLTLSAMPTGVVHSTAGVLSSSLVVTTDLADGSVTPQKINTTGAAAGDILTNVGGNATWQAPAAATVSTNATLLGNGTVGSPLGINLGNSNTWTANQTFGGTFLITSNSRIAMTNSDNNARDIRLQEPSGSGTQYVGFRCPPVSNNGNYLFPAVVGTVGQVLTLSVSNNIDSATMAWTTVSTSPTGAAGGDLSGTYPNPTVTNINGNPIPADASGILTNDGSGNLSWASSTINTNATLSGNGTVGSPLGINLGNSNTWTANQTFGGTFLITSNSRIAMTNNDNNARDIRLQEPSGSGTQYVGFRCPPVSNNGNYLFPAVVGTVGQVLTLSASNNIDSATMAWTTPSAAAITTNATLSGNGTVGSPLGINLGNSNTWTANQTFASSFLIVQNCRIALTNSDNNGRDVRWQEPSGTGSQYIGLRAPNLINNGNYMFPAVMGDVGDVLSLSFSNNIDSGTLVWNRRPISVFMGSTGNGTNANNFSAPTDRGNINVEAQVQTVCPRNATLRNLYINSSAAPGAGNSKTITVRINGVNSGLTATIANAATSANDIVSSVTVAAGDLISLQETEAGTPAASTVSWGFELY